MAELLLEDPEVLLDDPEVAAGLLAAEDEEDELESDFDSPDFFSAGFSAVVELVPLPPDRESVR